MIQTLSIEAVGPTLNMWYAGAHWSKRSRIKKDWHWLVRNAIDQWKIMPVKQYPIFIECRLTFGKGKRRYDWENCAPTAKLIQDALIREGILENDGPKHIAGGKLWAVRGDVTRTIYRMRPIENM